MSDIITFNTESGSTTVNPGDPWDHLPPEQWVEKQVEWGEANISGSGILKHIQKLQGPLIGAEIGVCLGVTTELYASEIPNLNTLYGVDHYPSFVDWNGTVVSQERQDCMKEHARNRLSRFNNIQLLYITSEEFASKIVDDSLDFIFIDGDHSYEGASRDFKNFWPKIKKGGIFAGHDLYIPTVSKALKDFFGDDVMDKITPESHNAWFMIKE